MIKFDIGPRQYELVEGWGNLPEGWKWGLCAGVACDSQDNVHVFTRTEHPYMVFDKKGKLAYHGSVDDNARNPGQVKSRYLRDALQAVVAGKSVAKAETKSIGCSIKYRKRTT